MVIAEITSQGVRHDDSCPKAAGCQEKDGRKAEGMPVLRWGDLSALGRNKEAGAGYMLSEYTGVSLSLLLLWADIQALSGRDERGGPDGAVAVVCGSLLDIGIEPSRGECDPEWFEDRDMPDDRVAGCPGAGKEAQAAKPVEAGASVGSGWSLCFGLGGEAPGAGGSRSWGRPAGSGGLRQRT